ncbi:LANO_0E16534g1_1 [Lachancea nothofagi CBS 11611]|uniref:LANO_0E16534g1_1 n=1 Tax=Lachancea nothofagi CBS 11611 TaxID=1266666 RepID=A0A1G4K244_9SACH|nr:LANO_0E16534g1_1 [Lachancea nothofagi CBS 11611]
MVKARRPSSKRYIYVVLPLAILGVWLWRFLNNPGATDLQTILQNLPKEVSQSIDSVSQQKQDATIVEMFEKLSVDLLQKQDEQLRKFEKERRALEKRIQDLRQPATHATLREKLAHMFEYRASQRFPAFVWQTWPYSDTDDRMDSSLQAFERHWGDKNPGFVHEIINDDTASALIHYMYASIPEVLDAYDILPSTNLKADFFKYLILLARGGVYADIDTDPLQPVPNWIPENVSPKEIGLIIGIENDANNPDWKSSFVRRLQFGNWIIQAKPGHPVVREVVARITEITLQRRSDGELRMNLRNDLNIMGWTGSGIWTDVVFTYMNDYVQSGILSKITWKEFHKLDVPKLVGDVLVFPQTSFNAPDKDIKDKNKALHFARHSGLKSWKAAPKVAEEN